MEVVRLKQARKQRLEAEAAAAEQATQAELDRQRKEEEAARALVDNKTNLEREIEFLQKEARPANVGGVHGRCGASCIIFVGVQVAIRNVYTHVHPTNTCHVCICRRRVCCLSSSISGIWYVGPCGPRVTNATVPMMC